MPVTIGITYCETWANYENWLKGFDADLTIVKLKAGESTMEHVECCNGIVLSGGADIHPSLYGKPEYVEQFNLHGFDMQRDEFEFTILNQAVKKNTPLLGICRGLQVTNVFFKGTLIPDLPSAGKAGHAGTGEQKGAEHTVQINKSSNLYTICGQEQGTTNSFHHQAADKLGEGLRATAFSENGVVEAMEKSNHKNSPFFTLVQWHPERMDIQNPLSTGLREAFIKACRKNILTPLNV